MTTILEMRDYNGDGKIDKEDILTRLAYLKEKQELDKNSAISKVKEEIRESLIKNRKLSRKEKVTLTNYWLETNSNRNDSSSSKKPVKPIKKQGEQTDPISVRLKAIKKKIKDKGGIYNEGLGVEVNENGEHCIMTMISYAGPGLVGSGSKIVCPSGTTVGGTLLK